LAKLICQGLRVPDQIKGSVASNNDGVKQTLAIALKLGSDAVRKLWADDDPQSMAGEIEDAGSTFTALEHHEAQTARGRKPGLTPTLPTSTTASTQLWPPASGRALLQSIEGKPLKRIPTPEKPQRMLLECDGWRLLTGTDFFYETLEAGTAALNKLTRRKVALAAWLAEPSALALVEDPSGTGYWMWQIDPVLPTIADALDNPDADHRRDSLSTFAEIVVGAEAMAESNALVVTLDPTMFGYQSGDRIRIRYIGDRLTSRRPLDSVGPVVKLAERFAGDEPALAEFTEILCLGFHYAPRGAERRAELCAEFESATVTSANAKRVCDAARRVLSRPAHE
jgi:hypothetical protein